ncbi:hypothetical protein LOD99_5930 [Oopsacas minuta]|uniref:SAM domain-containing protein n=1 Tax=Oopsacas minuta TaxID=111878 RepID=A0AAV7JMW8_9METZ|nr:hypothetical protein LOD99_5930 [Oopsacas minuta]
MASECNSGLFNTCDRMEGIGCLSSPHSGNSSTTCSQTGCGGQLDRGEVLPNKDKFDLHEWMRCVFLDDVDEEEIQRYVCLFTREGVNSPRVLNLLTDEDLKNELKIKLGHRRLLLNAISNFPVTSACRDSNATACMVDLEMSCDHLDYSGGICSMGVTECKLKAKKSDRALQRNTNDFQLRLDLRADKPVQRNDMQQMKLEAFMSRVTQSYPGCEVVNEMNIKCSICQKVIKLNNLRCMENFDRHHMMCSQKRFSPYITNYSMSCQQSLPRYTQSLMCPTSQSDLNMSSLPGVPLQCPITMIPICTDVKPDLEQLMSAKSIREYPRINFYRPHDDFYTSPPHRGGKWHRSRGRKETGHNFHRSLYEICLINLVVQSKHLIGHINILPEALLCDFYGALHQCNRACKKTDFKNILTDQLSDLDVLHRLLKAEHRRSILYGPIQFLCSETIGYLDRLMSSFSNMCIAEEGYISDTWRMEQVVSYGVLLGQLLQEIGWYRAASDVIRCVIRLIIPETSIRQKELFIDTGSRLMHCLSCDCKFSEAQGLEARCLQYIDQLTNQNIEIHHLAVIHARLAAMNDILCNYSVAKRWALKALECVSLQLPVKSIVFVFGQASKSCIVSKLFRKAESIARGAVNISSLYCGTSDPVYSDALMHLGYCNLSIDLTSAAVTCFERAHTIREEIFGENCVQSAFCHEDLAYSLYVKNYLEGFFSTALKHAELSISTFLESLGDDHLITASARRVKALIQEEIAIDSKDDSNRRKLLNDALSLHLGSLKLTVMAFGEDSVPTAKHYGNLGRLYQSLKEFQKAEKYHKDAIRIKEKHLGPDDYEVGLSVGHLAALYCYDMEKFRLAEPLYFRSIQIGLKLFGEGFSGLEFDYRGLIHLYKKTGDFTNRMKFVSKFDEYRFKRDQVSEKGATKEDTEPLSLLDTLEVLQSGPHTQGDLDQPMETSESILNYIMSQD